MLTEILSERAVKPKITNQPNYIHDVVSFFLRSPQLTIDDVAMVSASQFVLPSIYQLGIAVILLKYVCINPFFTFSYLETR